MTGWAEARGRVVRWARPHETMIRRSACVPSVRRSPLEGCDQGGDLSQCVSLKDDSSCSGE